MLEFKNKYPLKSHNTFGMDVCAEYFVQITQKEDIPELLRAETWKQNDRMILGGGSNVLLTRDINGLVIHIDLKGIEIIRETENHLFVKAMAGENWHQFVLWALAHEAGGVENLSLIPGNVGTAPMQNIGAYGVELKDVFHSLEAYMVEEGEFRIFENEECEFGYRESIFKNRLKNKAIITSVVFKLTKNHVLNTKYGDIGNELSLKGIQNPTIQDVSDAVIQIRKSKLPDPAEIGNSGSFFKNPVIDNALFQKLKGKYADLPGYPQPDGNVKVPAGWLIENAGWKGKRTGNYGVHAKQALVLVNYGGAKGADIYQLSEDIFQDVKRKYQISLEREVNVY